MARPAQITREKLVPFLYRREPVSAATMAAALGVNRSTIVRALARFGKDLVVLGNTRNTRYALRRPIRNLGSRWPIYQMDKSGRAALWAELEALQDRSWRVTWAGSRPAWVHHFSDAEGLWDGFPFFLGDIRPQGFLGRALAHKNARSLNLPENPIAWSDEDTLIFLQAAGVDLPGSFIVGDSCLAQANQQILFPREGSVLTRATAASFYPELAATATSSLAGSSAGGEQPKFLTTLLHEDGSHHPVLVKFSPPPGPAAGQRYGDLLLCEYHAHQVLANHGLARPGCRLLDAGGRRFLEVPRFDRSPGGGRRGVVSLAALHGSAIGAGHNDWPTQALELGDTGLMDAAGTAIVRRLHAFGDLIGNTDMHTGNLAFWLEESLPFHPAPAYDMLPMLWAPGPQGEIIPRVFRPGLPLPAARPAWLEAYPMALAFWQNAAADPRLSPEFLTFAWQAMDTLGKLRQQVG